MRNTIKTSAVFSDKNAFRKIREEQAKKETNKAETNALKHRLNTYTQIEHQDDIFMD